MTFKAAPNPTTSQKSVNTTVNSVGPTIGPKVTCSRVNKTYISNTMKYVNCCLTFKAAPIPTTSQKSVNTSVNSVGPTIVLNATYSYVNKFVSSKSFL